MSSYADKEAIMKVIPHRDPFLLVDEILESDYSYAVGHYTFKVDNPIFKGHFPDDPVVPGVYLIEAMAQTGAYSLLSNPAHKDKNVLLLKVNNARFRDIVRPGDKLKLKVQEKGFKLNTATSEAEGYINEKLVCSCELICAIVPK